MHQSARDSDLDWDSCARCGRDLFLAIDETDPGPDEITGEVDHMGPWCGQCLDQPRFLILDEETIPAKHLYRSTFAGLTLVSSGRRDWYVAPDSRAADAAARDGWRVPAIASPIEFASPDLVAALGFTPTVAYRYS